MLFQTADGGKVRKFAGLGASSQYDCPLKLIPIISAKTRTEDGKITWNTTFYPSGYPVLIDYVHDLGLKFGIYSGAGNQTFWSSIPV